MPAHCTGHKSRARSNLIFAPGCRAVFRVWPLPPPQQRRRPPPAGRWPSSRTGSGVAPPRTRASARSWRRTALWCAAICAGPATSQHLRNSGDIMSHHDPTSKKTPRGRYAHARHIPVAAGDCARARRRFGGLYRGVDFTADRHLDASIHTPHRGRPRNRRQMARRACTAAWTATTRGRGSSGGASRRREP